MTFQRLKLWSIYVSSLYAFLILKYIYLFSVYCIDDLILFVFLQKSCGNLNGKRRVRISTAHTHRPRCRPGWIKATSKILFLCVNVVQMVSSTTRQEWILNCTCRHFLHHIPYKWFGLISEPGHRLSFSVCSSGFLSLPRNKDFLLF